MEDDPFADGIKFYGVVKSYNERRGFGFVACEETARRFGRDVYLSKEEAIALTQEAEVGASLEQQEKQKAAAAAAAAAEEDGTLVPSIKEGDFLQFQVQRSTEGFPQAAVARRMRRLKGVVLRAAQDEGSAAAGVPGDVDGLILVKGDDDTSKQASNYDASGLSSFVGREVRVRQADCGQLRLAANDEVAFCCSVAGNGSSNQLEAQLVELLATARSSSQLLGCFSLELPRIGGAAISPTNGECGDSVAKPCLLDGHALTDRVVLAGLPQDLEVPELMRLFSKLGATEVVISHPEEAASNEEGEEPSVTGYSRGRGFAAVTFPGPVQVARMLVRAAHTINEQGATQLARLLPCRRSSSFGPPTLPALPIPTLSAEDGSLMVRWAKVGLAVGYAVDLRPALEEDEEDDETAWRRLDASSGLRAASEAPSDTPLPSGLLGSNCSACRIASGLEASRSFQARILYYASCGCRSQASAPSEACSAPNASDSAPSSAAERVPSKPRFDLSAAVGEATSWPGLSSALEGSGCQGPWSGKDSLYGTSASAGGGGGIGPLSTPAPTSAGAVRLSTNGAPGEMLSLSEATTPGWRCFHGNLIPAPAAPELLAFEEAAGTRTILIQWPCVIHAASYSIDLYDEGTANIERFHRNASEGLQEALAELRVVNLQPGSYGACVRCVAPCGCESVASAWSFLSSSCMPAPPLGAGWQYPSQATSPYVGGSSSSTALLSTNPNHVGRIGSSLLGTGAPPPPPPSAPPSTAGVAAGGTGQTGPPSAPPSVAPSLAAAGPPPPTGSDVLVLD